ncbi:MAG: CDP-alcohol phosphatidyltransferase family protein [Gemmatimonadales bacterium]
MVWTLPNIITLTRIGLAPVIALLPFINGHVPKIIAFVVFLAASISDAFDGKLARSRGEVTDLGKELDPLADKLLLFATLIPIYWITRYPLQQYEIPWWGSFPLWVAVLLIGRELAMTVLRRIAARRGVPIPAGGAGKVKTIFQHIFIGGMIAWFAWRDMSLRFGWKRGWFGAFWDKFHGIVIAVTLALAIILTLYSLIDYLYKYRRVLFGVHAPGTGDGA